MIKNLKILIFLLSIFLAGFLVSDSANAQVRVENFNVIQKNIPATASSLDFRLTVSQPDTSLDCSSIPGSLGSLQWRVFFEASGRPITVVRSGSLNLPLSPLTRNLDFLETVNPSAINIQSGTLNFKADLRCDGFLVGAGALATSAPIAVAVGAGTGGGPPGTGGGPPGGGDSFEFKIENPIAANSFIDLVKAIARFLLQIGIPIVVIIIIYAGLLFLTSGGSQEKVKKAKTALLYAVIGLAIILIGQGFVTLIQSILNLGGPTP